MALFTGHIDKNKNSDKIKSRLGCGEVTTLRHCWGGGCPATLEDNLVASCNLNAFVPYNLYVLASAASLGKKHIHIPKSIPIGGGVCIAIANKQKRR